MNSSRYALPAAVLLLFYAVAAFALSIAPPDMRSWEQVTADFVSREARHANDGEYDGRRLKELNPKRAVEFLMPFLAKDRPFGLRIKAIGALGWSSFQEALPALSTIAQDATDDDEVRSEALNPGLCYMRHPEAVRAATAVAGDKSAKVRTSAYWVLAHHGTDAAISVLEARLKAKDAAGLRDLIYALNFSKHPRAGKIVFDYCDFAALPADETYLHAYSLTMDTYRVPDAQQNMLRVAQQVQHRLPAYYALRYFESFPREDVVPALIRYIEADNSVSDLYETVTAFIKSSDIGSESKKRLSALIATGKVKKSEPLTP